MAPSATQATKLDRHLLVTDEEEYDRLATELSSHNSKLTDLDTQNLDGCDLSHQTIPFAYTLIAHIDTSIRTGKAPGRQLPASVLPEGRLWPYIAQFLTAFEPIQVRYIGHAFLKIVEVVVRGAEQTCDYVPAIQLLGIAIIRLDPTSSTLTSTHVHYVRLSLLARAYANAVSILDMPIYSLTSTETVKQIGNKALKYLCSEYESSASFLTPSTGLTQRITSRVYLEYFLMGAMCYLGAGRYHEALLFFEIVLTTPALQNAVSMVQLETYKKWLLLNLIVYGKPGKFPSSLSQLAHRNLRAAAKPYECIVDAFKSGKIDRLQGEIQEGILLWQEDENYGLMHETFAAFRRFSVIRLGKIYAAVSISEVARLTSTEPSDISATLAYVSGLIEGGELQAVLASPNDGAQIILRFPTDQARPIEEAQAEQEMLVRTRELQQLLKHISNLDQNMAIHKDYIDLLQKLRNSRDREKKGSVPANRSTAMMDPDEDMMDDL